MFTELKTGEGIVVCGIVYRGGSPAGNVRGSTAGFGGIEGVSLMQNEQLNMKNTLNSRNVSDTSNWECKTHFHNTFT